MTQEGDEKMTETWEGGNASRRLGAWYDEDMKHWAVSGRHEHDAGSGTAADMVKLARIILENIPDPDAEPLDLIDVADRLPHWAGAALDIVAEAVTTNARGMNDGEKALMGNALVTAGLHLVRLARQEARNQPESARERHPELLREPVDAPFGLRAAPRRGWEETHPIPN